MVLIPFVRKGRKTSIPEFGHISRFHNSDQFFAQLVRVSVGNNITFTLSFMVDLYYFQDIGKGESIKWVIFLSYLH